MPAMSRASASVPARPFPPAIERSVGAVGRPLIWLWDHGFRFLVVLAAIGLGFIAAALFQAKNAYDAHFMKKISRQAPASVETST